MNKYILFGVVLLALVGGFVFVGQSILNSNVEELSGEQAATGTVVVRGTVTDVDNSGVMLDGPSVVTITDESNALRMIAIPSMGIRVCAGYPNITGGGAIAVGDSIEIRGTVNEEGYIVPCSDADDYLHVTHTYENPEYQFAFDYKAGDSGYIFEDEMVGFSEHPNFKYGIMLTDAQDYEEFHSATDAREGPQTIQIRVFENTEKLSPFVWVERNKLESNIDLKIGEVKEAVVGGANAAHYTTDGLFTTNTYVVASNGYIYLLMGMSMETGNEIATDFRTLVDSFHFIAPAQQQASAQMKIDINAVCASAMASMSFVDGAAADAFLEECINGEHPDVVDRYIEGLGLDGAAI